VTYDFDRFLRYDELTAWLESLAADHPGLVELESIGRSYEGRDLWLATVTDAATGPHHEKPAHWVDANIHSVELTAGVAAMFLLHRLVTGQVAGDDIICRALATRTFYVVPRVNPDGPSFAGRACAPGRGVTVTAGPACTPRTSTVTAASVPCASPTRTGLGRNTPTIRG
jgi:murein tripeptide amidase MpaA